MSEFQKRNTPEIAIAILLIMFFVLSCAKQAVKPEVFDPEKAFAEADKKIEKGYYEEARAALLEIKNRSQKLAPFAQLKIADSYAKEKKYEVAVAEYQKFLESYPDHQYAVYARYQIAMTYFNQIGGPDRGHTWAAMALEEFERLKKMFPRNPYKDIIDIRIQQCKSVLAEHEFLVGKFYYKKGSYNAAIGRFEELIEKYPDYGKEDHVLFYIGMSYKNLGQKNKAIEYLTSLLKKYPNSKLAKDAKKELAK